MIKRGSWIAAALLLVLRTTAMGATEAATCKAAKIKIAAKYHYCLLKADAKAVKTGNPADYSRCDSKFALMWAAAESSGGGMCPTNGDQTAVQNQMRTERDALVMQLSGPRFVDNGDGSVTDTQTGLTWEKKDNLGGIHDKDNLYSWSATGTAPDGTAFTTFLSTLNNGGSGCFANHCDWRLPSLTELQTILLEPFPCGTSPCVDPVFAPNEPGSYWSGTTNIDGPTGAWYIFFVDGTAVLGPKVNTLFVRAVR